MKPSCNIADECSLPQVNPPYFMPLVEIVPSPWTAPDVVRKTRQLLKDIGQSPVTLNKEVAGFIQPRIQFAILQEALRLVVVSTYIWDSSLDCIKDAI